MFHNSADVAIWYPKWKWQWSVGFSSRQEPVATRKKYCLDYLLQAKQGLKKHKFLSLSSRIGFKNPGFLAVMVLALKSLAFGYRNF